MGPIAEFDKGQLNPMDFSLSVCAEVNMVSCFIRCSLGCLRTSCKRTGDDATPVADPPVSMALSTLQWLECSKNT